MIDGASNIRIVGCEMGLPVVTPTGEFTMGALETLSNDSGKLAEHLVVYLNIDTRPLNVRINSACFTGDIFRDSRCDCSWQMNEFLRLIHVQQQGLLIYHLHHEGRGNGAVAKLRSYRAASKGDLGRLAYEKLGLCAERRRYESSATVLRHLGIQEVVLFTNNPEKLCALERNGIAISSRQPLRSPAPELDEFYKWKRDDFAHDV